MKRITLCAYALFALVFVFTSCTQDSTDQVNLEAEKVEVEPDFLERDGAMEEGELEEEAPTENTKTYGYRYNYTLLKPSHLKQEDVNAITCGESTTMPILVGSRKKQVGEVEVSNDDDNLYLTFSASQHNYMKKVYLYIGDKGSVPYYSNGFPNLRKFNFKAFPYYYGGTKKATYVIPLSSIDSDCFEIVAYSKVYNSYSGCYYTSFAYPKENTQTGYYSYYSGCFYYNDWVRSFEYCKKSCQDDCVEAYAYHDGCGFCTDDGGFTNEFAYGSLATWGFALIDLYTEPDGCDITGATKVGFIKLSFADPNTLLAEYYLNDGYAVCEVSLYADVDMNPANGSNTYHAEYDTPTSTPASFTLPWSETTKNIFVKGGAKIVAVPTNH